MDKIGYISQINYGQVTVKIESEDFNSSNGYSSSKITLNTMLICDVNTKESICLRVFEVKDFKNQDFNNLEWQKNEVEIKCEYLGTYFKDEKIFKKEIKKYPLINSEVFLVNGEISKKIVNNTIDDKTIVMGSWFEDENIDYYLNISEFVKKHCLIVGNTGSGKSRTLSNLIGMIQRHRHEGKKLIPKIIIIDPYGEFDSDTINNRVFKDLTDIESYKNEEEYPKISLYGDKYGLSMWELIELLNLTPTSRDYLLTEINQIKTFEDIENKLLQFSSENGTIKSRIQSDFPKLKKLEKNDVFSKLINNMGNNFVLNFLESKNSVLVIKQSLENEIDAILFKLITKTIYKYSASRSTIDKKHVMLAIDESHRLFLQNDNDNDKLYYLKLLIREGRKWNFNSVFLTQSPSDIDKIALAQFNNFIIHKTFEKKDLSTVSSFVKSFDEFSERLRFLPPGVALCSGEVFTNPVLVKMNDVGDLNISPVNPLDSWVVKE